MPKLNRILLKSKTPEFFYGYCPVWFICLMTVTRFMLNTSLVDAR